MQMSCQALEMPHLEKQLKRSWARTAQHVQWRFKQWPEAHAVVGNLHGLELFKQSKDFRFLAITPEDLGKAEWNEEDPTKVVLQHGSDKYRLRFVSCITAFGFLRGLEQHRLSNAYAQRDNVQAEAALRALACIDAASNRAQAARVTNWLLTLTMVAVVGLVVVRTCKSTKNV